MQQHYNVIAKGEYAYKQTSDFLHIERFLIIRKRGRRWLLLDCDNLSESELTGLTLSVQQFDPRGNELGERVAKIKKISFKHGKFILKYAVALDGGCVDVRIKVLCVEYGNISYRLGKEDVYAVFERPTNWKKLTKKEISKKTGKDGRTQESRRFNPPAVFSVLAIIIIVFSCIVALTQLSDFATEGDEFFISNIRYRYASSFQNDDSPVYVVGSVGFGRQTLYIPSEVEGHPVVRIEAGAFSSDSVVHKLTVANGVAVESGAFSFCDSLNEVVLEGNNEVGYHAFYSCTQLQKVTINKALTIGYEAFSDCDIRSLRINGCADGYETVEMVSRAFADCGSAIDSIYIDAYMRHTEGSDIFQNSQSKKIYLKNYNYGMYENTSDKSLATFFGGSVADVESVEIGYADCIPNLFLYNANQLKSVKINNLDSTEVGNQAFYNCFELSTVFLPTNITYVGQSAFEETAITSFNASSLRGMGASAFSSCSKLKEVRFDNNTMLTDLPNSAFAHCYSLQTISLPQNIKTIGSYAFNGCKGLKTFVVPSSVTSISDSAFNGCYRLHEIHNLSSLPISVGSDDYGGIAFNAIAVYSDLQSSLLKKEYDGFVFESAYGSDWWLVDYTGSERNITLDLKKDVSTYHVSRYAFDEDNFGICSIELTAAVTSVKDEAFVSLPNLATVFLQSDVCSLPSYAFYDCYYLSAVVLPMLFNVNINSTSFGYTSPTYYYEGSRTAWTSRGYSLPDAYNTILYYAWCIHEYDEWNYVNGLINTQQPDYELITLVAPTCKTAGTGQYRCKTCGYTTDTFSLTPLGHDYNTDGVCIRCGYVSNFTANDGTLKKFYEYVTPTNDKNAPFEVFNQTSTLPSICDPKGEISEPTMEIKANEDIIISMYVYAFRNYAFTISAGDTQVFKDVNKYRLFKLYRRQTFKSTDKNKLDDSNKDDAYLCSTMISSMFEPQIAEVWDRIC